MESSEKMTKDNCARMFLDVCKHYNDYYRIVVECYNIAYPMYNRILNVKAPSLDGFRGGNIDRSIIHDQWRTIDDAVARSKYYISMLNWVNSILGRIRNRTYVLMIKACYINNDTLSRYAREMRISDSKLRDNILIAVKSVITSKDIGDYNFVASRKNVFGGNAQG